MQVMELREGVEEAEDAEALNKIQAQVHTLLTNNICIWIDPGSCLPFYSCALQLQEKLQYWSSSFNDAYRSKNYEDALASIRRMTYYKRANEEIVKRL